jgi:uncharacterized OB-fold protein
MSDSFAKPVPHPTPDTQPFWDGLARGEYLIQRCRDCGKLRHYPRPVCDGCWSMAHEWVPASGRGTVHSWTVCHHPFHMGFKAQSPYILLTVDLVYVHGLLDQLSRKLGERQGNRPNDPKASSPSAAAGACSCVHGRGSQRLNEDPG